MIVISRTKLAKSLDGRAGAGLPSIIQRWPGRNSHEILPGLFLNGIIVAAAFATRQLPGMAMFNPMMAVGDWNRVARGAATFYSPACHGLCWSPIRSEVEHETVGRVHSIHSTPGASFARKWLSANLIRTFRTASPA